MELDALLEYIPPITRYRREPLADAHNALSYWSAAAEGMTPLGSDLWDRISVGAEEETVVAPTERSTRRDEATEKALREVVGCNEPTFQLLDQGLACGRVQFPEFNEEGGSVSEHDETMRLMRDLARLRWASARLQLAERRFAESARELIALGQMGHLLCCGESFVMHYLIGGVVMDHAESGIALLAAAPDVPVETFAEILAAVDRWIAEADAVVQCQRVELCSYAIPELVRLDACDDTTALIDQLLERHYSDAPVLAPDDEDEAPAEDDRRGEWRREAIQFLLADHPEPFELVPSVACLGQQIADRIEELLQFRARGLPAGWRRLTRKFRQQRFLARVRVWPIQLGPGFPFDCLGPSDAALGALSDLMREHVSAAQWRAYQPPTQAQLAATRARLRWMPNALGWLIVQTLLSVGIAQTERVRRARLEAVRQSLTKRLRD